MRVTTQNLKKNLEKVKTPIFLVSGDDPLQFNEACDEIRNYYKKKGFEERDVIESNKNFNWDILFAQTNSLSLFSKKKFIDLKLSNGKIGKEGSMAITDYCKSFPEDTVMLISMPKLEKAQQNTQWFKYLDKVGVIIQIWPIDVSKMGNWILNRFKKIGVQSDPEVIKIIIDKAEGNLLAANQEIEKLYLLYGKENIDIEKFKSSVTDNSKFNIFELVDAAVDGNPYRSVRILNGLKNEGLPPSIILWALHREISQISAISADIALGAGIDATMAKFRVWEKRKPAIRSAILKTKTTEWLNLLSNCHEIDGTIKGVNTDNAWVKLENLCAHFSGCHKTY
tara:strand:- start:12191 stop:13207 length:1017 start_codon:yes stop_codon:yes gene_type:complete